MLLTDFGNDSYVGIVKGVILSLCPQTTIVDLAHHVEPQAVRQAAWLLLTAYSFFPPGSVFLVVVDPGVGTERQALAVQAGDYCFVGPDNGVLYPAAISAGETLQAVALPVPEGASSTFHGRDVFAPAAAKLASGRPLTELGSRTEMQARLQFYLSGREGEVVTLDRFGNVITNLPPVPGRRRYRVTLCREGRQYWQGEVPCYRAYAHASEASPFLIVGSAGTLELSIRNGSAAESLGVRMGDYLRAE
ncbi:MAG: SAM hydrolase/SAM-dependent halogenase family protein [Moorellales bacterium]